MGNFIFLLIIGLVAFIFIKKDVNKPSTAKRYMKAMAKFLGYKNPEGDKDALPNRIEFTYEGHPFVYEHIEESVSRGKVLHRGCLKAKTSLNLTINFTERSRQSIRVNLDTLLDASTPSTPGQIPLPKIFEDFELITNDRIKAIELFSDNQMLKMFQKFKNRDSVGHPVMSLEIVEGFVVLHFHPPGGLKPSLMNLQLNVTSIEEYIRTILPLVKKLNDMN